MTTSLNERASPERRTFAVRRRLEAAANITVGAMLSWSNNEMWRGTGAP
jgi:hypothetical protein